MRGGGCRTCALIGLAIASIACAAPAFAQDEAAARREFDTLFQQLLLRPADAATNRRFVKVALALKDYEAAIGALERLLFYAPEDAELNLQLGSAYFELGSYVIAKSYFESAAEFGALSPRIVEQARAGVEAADQRGRPSPWRIYAQSGLRYQTNATVGPDDLDLDGGALARPDFNAFVLSTVSYVRPFGDRAVFEASATGYYADQFKEDQLDLGLVDLIAGPRLRVTSGESAAEISVKPYAIAGVTTLADELYRRSFGGGLSIRAELGDSLVLEPYAEYRDRRYYDSEPFYETASDQTGELKTVAALASAELGAKARLSSRGGYNRNDARADDESYDEFFIDATLQLRFNPLDGEDGRDWTLAPFGAFVWTLYDAPEGGDDDPANDGVADREDIQWRGGARLDIPVAERFGLGTTVQYTVNESNDSRFDYDNLQITSGPTIRF